MNYQIVWEGVIHDSTGYATAARESVLALDALGLNVKVNPMNLGTPPVPLPMGTLEKLKGLIDKPLSRGEKALIFHHPPYLCDVAKARSMYDAVLFNCLWETTKLPWQWYPKVKEFDHIIAPSSWIRDVLIANDITTPISVALFGAGGHEPHHDEKYAFYPRATDFKFLSVGTWQHRKGFDVLLRAFLEEFGWAEQVSLVIKTFLLGNPWANRQIRDAIRRLRDGSDRNGGRVYVSSEDLSNSEMMTLYNTCDAFVLPSRGEGVGLPYLEAMKRGLPVIATNFGGQEDFLNADNSYLVDHKDAPVPLVVNPPGCIAPHPAPMYSKGMMWAEPDVGSLRRQMRAVYSDPQAAKSKAQQAMTRLTTWEDSARSIKKAVEAALEI
jgi:glycosyltransferase involved in cell wall biosynthesis